jgi:hypothetical protein
MPSLHPTLTSLHPCSHVSHLPRLVVVLPLVLRCLSFSSCHRLPSGGAYTCPHLVAPPPLLVSLFFSGVVASRPPRLFFVSPLLTPLPTICLRLCLSLHHCLSLCSSCASCPAGCCIAPHYANASCLLAIPTLVELLPLVAPLSCLLSTLAGCCVASPHDGATHLPAPLPPKNSL